MLLKRRTNTVRTLWYCIEDAIETCTVSVILQKAICAHTHCIQVRSFLSLSTSCDLYRNTCVCTRAFAYVRARTYIHVYRYNVYMFAHVCTSASAIHHMPLSVYVYIYFCPTVRLSLFLALALFLSFCISVLVSMPSSLFFCLCVSPAMHCLVLSCPLLFYPALFI